MIVSSLRVRPRVVRLGRLLHVPSTRAISTTSRMSNLEEPLGDEQLGYFALKVGGFVEGDGGERYEAVRKLGWGINSSVWMGRDCSDDANPKYVALKILNKRATQEHDSSQTSELKMLARTYKGIEPEHRTPMPSYDEQGLKDPPHPGWLRVSGCLGAFTCEHSQHLVIVSPIYGEHMKNYMYGEPGQRLAPEFVKKVASHTLLALDYLHSNCGIIHSDVKPENILLDFDCGPKIDDIVEAILKKDPDSGRDGRSAPLWMPHMKDVKYFCVVLSDLSHATWKDFIQRSPLRVGSPALKAPELVLGYAFSTAVDIWAFGCTIFELLSGKSLFRFPDSRSPNELAQDPPYHLSLMQRLVGEPFFPNASEGTIAVKKGFIDPDGWIKEPAEGASLDERIAKDLPDVEDKDMLVAFLRRCVRIDSDERASASELLDDPWLKKAC